VSVPEVIRLNTESLIWKFGELEMKTTKYVRM